MNFYKIVIFLVFIASPVHAFDINGDGKIGLEEAIYALQVVAGKTFENTPAACSDGVDNDGDGFIDCDDFDCAGY
ncbi:MAG TPA: hypothetical protein ENN79_05705 [Desulfobacteraceae bacterium]|nr:hypothetical protein [Desulfobacteraceae bacterium]